MLLLSYGVWQRDFGGAPTIGQGCPPNGKPATIIGVIPGFQLPNNEEMWTPSSASSSGKRTDPQGNNPAVLGLIRKSLLSSAG